MIDDEKYFRMIEEAVKKEREEIKNLLEED